MRRLRINNKKMLLILILFISIGFAYLSAALNINGLAIFNPVSWDVYFDNVTYKSVEATVNEEPEIVDKTTINFSVLLETTGSSLILESDIVNNGTIDAMVDSVQVSGFEDVSSFIEYEITYKDGVPIEQFNLLKSNSTERIKLKVTFKEDITEEDLPTADGTINASIIINYQNATDEAKEREHNNGLFVSGPDFRSKMSKIYGGSGDVVYDIRQVNVIVENELPDNITMTNDNLITMIDEENGYNSHAYVWGEVLNEEDGNRFSDCTEYDPDTDECINEVEYVRFYNVDLHMYLEPGKYYLNENSSKFFMDFVFDDTLTDLITEFDSSLVVDASYMFYHSKIDKLDLSNWNTSNVTNMSHMFEGYYRGSDFGILYSIENIDVSNFDTSKVTDMSYMFAYCDKITGLDLSKFETDNVTDFSGMFLDNYLLLNIHMNPNKFKTGSALNLSSMFENCGSLQSLDVSKFDTSKCKYFDLMFKSCSSLSTLDVSNWDTSEAVSFAYMFSYLSHVSTLAVDNWNTSNVTSISGTFSRCESITSLDLSEWNTSKITGLFETFSDCYALRNLNLSNWDTSNATTFQSAFRRCRSLTTLDLSSFDTSKVTQAYFCFSGCTSLTTIFVSNLWDFTHVSSLYGFSVFSDCTSLVGGNGTAYNSSYTESNYARIDGKNGLPGYLTLKS